MYTYICIHTYVYVCMYVCMYIYIVNVYSVLPQISLPQLSDSSSKTAAVKTAVVIGQLSTMLHTKQRRVIRHPQASHPPPHPHTPLPIHTNPLPHPHTLIHIRTHPSPSTHPAPHPHTLLRQPSAKTAILISGIECGCPILGVCMPRYHTLLPHTLALLRSVKTEQ